MYVFFSSACFLVKKKCDNSQMNYNIIIDFFVVVIVAGIEMMKLFVFANTMMLFITVAWPSIKESLYIIRDYFLEE